jgi:hypothetical protein
MRELPPRLPERGRWAYLAHWLNRLRDYVQSLTPIQSFNTRTSHTATGVVREGRAAGEGGGGEDDSTWL